MLTTSNNRLPYFVPNLTRHPTVVLVTCIVGLTIGSKIEPQQLNINSSAVCQPRVDVLGLVDNLKTIEDYVQILNNTKLNLTLQHLTSMVPMPDGQSIIALQIPTDYSWQDTFRTCLMAGTLLYSPTSEQEIEQIIKRLPFYPDIMFLFGITPDNKRKVLLDLTYTLDLTTLLNLTYSAYGQMASIDYRNNKIGIRVHEHPPNGRARVLCRSSSVPSEALRIFKRKTASTATQIQKTFKDNFVKIKDLFNISYNLNIETHNYTSLKSMDFEREHCLDLMINLGSLNIRVYPHISDDNLEESEILLDEAEAKMKKFYDKISLFLLAIKANPKQTLQCRNPPTSILDYFMSLAEDQIARLAYLISVGTLVAILIMTILGTGFSLIASRRYNAVLRGSYVRTLTREH